MFGIEQFSALRRGVTLRDFLAYLRGVLGRPAFLFVQKRNGMLDKLIRGFIGATLYVLLDEFFQLGA